jgi:hypothetical protein
LPEDYARLLAYTLADGQDAGGNRIIPCYLSHSGGHLGFTSRFNVDRAKKNGIVIMINGNEDWQKKDAEYGANALRFDIYEAFQRAYR